MERTKTLPTQPNLKNCRQFWSIQLSDDGFIVSKFSGGQACGRVKWNSTRPSWLICTAYFNRWLLIIGCVALLFYLWQLSHPLFLICSYLSLSVSPPSSHISEQWGSIIWFWCDKYRCVRLVSDQHPPKRKRKKKNLDLKLLRWHGHQIQCAFNCNHQIWTSQYKLETYQLSRSRYSELTPPPPLHPPQKQTNLNQYALFGS